MRLETYSASSQMTFSFSTTCLQASTHVCNLIVDFCEYFDVCVRLGTVNFTRVVQVRVVQVRAKGDVFDSRLRCFAGQLGTDRSVVSRVRATDATSNDVAVMCEVCVCVCFSLHV